jgi:flagellar motor switch protein FliN/FliY
MATANVLPPQTAEPALDAEVQESTPEQALVPAEPELEPEIEPERMQLSPPVARLPVELDVAIPVSEFRVRDLLNLAHGSVIATQWINGDDLPLQAGKVQLAWSEFEVVDTQLAVRITRLS